MTLGKDAGRVSVVDDAVGLQRAALVVDLHVAARRDGVLRVVLDQFLRFDDHALRRDAFRGVLRVSGPERRRQGKRRHAGGGERTQDGPSVNGVRASSDRADTPPHQPSS